MNQTRGLSLLATVVSPPSGASLAGASLVGASLVGASLGVLSVPPQAARQNTMTRARISARNFFTGINLFHFIILNGFPLKTHPFYHNLIKIFFGIQG